MLKIIDRKTLIKSGIICAMTALPVYAVLPGHATKKQKEPFMGRNFAHRGLHSRDKKVPENSLEAFELAMKAGYGVELDVQLSKDGQVVVFHDDTLDRVCGVHAKVCDKDYSELSQLKLCGSENRIPLFTEVLQTINGRGPIICELKTGKRNRELCKKTYEILSQYKGDVCIESFDPTIVRWFKIHARNLVRGQLTASTDNFKGDQGLTMAVLMSHLAFNFLGRPQFIAYKLEPKTIPVRLNYALGCMKVCWTSHEPRNEKGQDAVIFEYYKPRQYFK